MTQVGNAMVTAVVTGDVAAVKAAVEAGRASAQALGEIVSTSIIARPNSDLTAVLPKAK
jgi:microcompartment protein CcmL/EutN